MMRFIYFCMALLVLSFIGVPIYNGVSSEHEKITTLATTETPSDDSLSFAEIYAQAEDTTLDNPAFLNDIMPAAGDNNSSDNFSSGFRNQEDSALAETPAAADIIEEEKTDL